MRVPGIAAARLPVRVSAGQKICAVTTSPGGLLFSPHPAVIAHKADAARDAGVCVNG